ncbi:MAG: preprotein translocase subunit YajC [Acidobacteriota bacterium]|nr:preprotein translocase subunit YajC [Acidobacteriota bacterium]MDE3192044.1 preprotein translocase subunit YajC [Acidobacteriota bacterium]
MSGPGFLLIIVAFAFLYFVLVRPQKKRQLQARQMLDAVKIGDEVVTAAGIYGRVTELHDDDLMVEIAPNTVVKVARRAIGGIVPPQDAEIDASGEEPPAAEDGG